jgi:hypothetical protein
MYIGFISWGVIKIPNANLEAKVQVYQPVLILNLPASNCWSIDG